MAFLTLWVPDSWSWTTGDIRDFKAAVADIAASHGYSTKRGPDAGKRGNVVEMLTAIVGGELATILLADEQRDYAIRRLRELAPGQDAITADAFLSLADQLEAAWQRDHS